MGALEERITPGRVRHILVEWIKSNPLVFKGKEDLVARVMGHSIRMWVRVYDPAVNHRDVAGALDAMAVRGTAGLPVHSRLLAMMTRPPPCHNPCVQRVRMEIRKEMAATLQAKVGQAAPDPPLVPTVRRLYRRGQDGSRVRCRVEDVRGLAMRSLAEGAEAGPAAAVAAVAMECEEREEMLAVDTDSDGEMVEEGQVVEDSEDDGAEEEGEEGVGSESD